MKLELMLHVSIFFLYNLIIIHLINYIYSFLDNTNNLKFELYVVHAEIDGMGFPLAYLFMENNGNCGNGIRTGILIDFLA